MTKKILFLTLVCLVTSSAYAESVCTAYCVKTDSTGKLTVSTSEMVKLTTRSVDEMVLKCMGAGSRLVQISMPTETESTTHSLQDYKIATAQNSCSDSLDPLVAEEEEVQDNDLTQEALNALLENPTTEQKEVL